VANKKYPKPEYLSKSDIREEAAAFLEEFADSDAIPVDIESIVDANIGLDIIPLDGVFRAYGIDGFLSGDMKSIYVDKYISSGKPLHRYRFTLAHEIGHWYLHEALYRSAGYDRPEEFIAFRNALDVEDAAWYEWQAREFAGLILVPPAALETKVREAIAAAAKRGLTHVDLRSDAHRDAVAEWIGKRMEVSMDVIRLRGGADGHWSS
jgi:hypothetical protein